MHARVVLIAAATLSSGAAFAAEPVKAPVQPAVQQQPVRPQVVLAAADDVRAPSPTEQQVPSPPKGPRVGRVTTCRCGDAQAQPDR